MIRLKSMLTKKVAGQPLEADLVERNESSTPLSILKRSPDNSFRSIVCTLVGHPPYPAGEQVPVGAGFTPARLAFTGFKSLDLGYTNQQLVDTGPQ